MTHILRVSDPIEIAALVPYQLGYRPADSVVFVSLRGARRRVGVIARCDLTDLQGAAGALVSSDVADVLRRDGAAAAILVAYVRGRGVAARRIAAAAFAVAIGELSVSDGHASAGNAARVPHGYRRAVAGRSYGDRSAPGWPIDVADVIISDDDGLTVAQVGQAMTEFCVARRSRASGPVAESVARRAEALLSYQDERHPHAALESSQVAATMVAEGAVVRARRSDLVAIDVADERNRARAGKGAQEWRQSWLAASASGQRQGAIAVALGRWGGVFRRAPGDLPEAAELGALGQMITDHEIRDGVLALACRVAVGEPEQPAAPSADTAAAFTATLADMIDGGGPPPQRGALEWPLELLRQVVAHADAAAQVEALAVIAVLHWWAGNGAASRLAVERGMRCDPGHTLTSLVTHLLDDAVPPGWVRWGTSVA